MITRCLEIIGPSLLLHIHIVYAGRGYDLKNINSYEDGQMHRHLVAGKYHRFVKQMQTASFHAFLRVNIQRFVTLLKETTQTALNTNKHRLENVIQRPLILDMVFKKRKQFSLLNNSQMRIEIAVPKVSLEDVRLFVHGGEDPVSAFLRGVADREREMIQNYERRRKSPRNKPISAVTGTAIPVATTAATPALTTPVAPPLLQEPPKPQKLVNNTMLFLVGLSVEQLALLAVSIAEKAAQHHASSGAPVRHMAATSFSATTNASTAAALSQYADLNPALLAALSAAAVANANPPDVVNRRMSTITGGSFNGSNLASTSNNNMGGANMLGGGDLIGYTQIEEEVSPVQSKPTSRRSSTQHGGGGKGGHPPPPRRTMIRLSPPGSPRNGRPASSHAHAPPGRPRSAVLRAGSGTGHRKIVG
jgi:hypothetical protein